MTTFNIEVKQTGLDEIEARVDRLVEKIRLLRKNLQSPAPVGEELPVSGPPNWEYQVKRHSFANGDTDDIRRVLNGYGTAGW